MRGTRLLALALATAPILIAAPAAGAICRYGVADSGQGAYVYLGSYPASTDTLVVVDEGSAWIDGPCLPPPSPWESFVVGVPVGVHGAYARVGSDGNLTVDVSPQYLDVCAQNVCLGDV